MFVNLVRSGCAVMQSDNATEPGNRLGPERARAVAHAQREARAAPGHLGFGRIIASE